MAMEERWPELARIKERFDKRDKPSLMEELTETLGPLIGPFGEVMRDQIQRMRGTDPMVGMVQVGPDHWERPGAIGVATTGNANFSMNMLAGPMGSLVVDPYSNLPPGDKELMERLLTELGPDIRLQTEELIKTEVRDSMMLGGNWPRLKELILKGEKPKVVRKRQGGRDPLFLQFGDGVGTEIEEVRILG